MKKTVFIRSTVRQPVRSLFILLLVGVISFSFVSRVGEAALIKQETAELISYYRTIANLSPLEPDQYGYNWTCIPDQVIEYLEQSPYVAYIDQRQYVSGVLQNGIYNSDTGGFNYNIWLRYGYSPEINPNNVFFYGTYLGEEATPPSDAPRKYQYYKFSVDAVLSGHPEYVSEQKTIYLYTDKGALDQDTIHQLKAGERYLIRGNYNNADHTFPLHSFQYFAWLPLTSDLPYFLPAESDIDLSLSEYAQFSSEMKQCYENSCALDIIATADMSAMPHFQPDFIGNNQEHYYLAAGRWLDHEDDLSGNRVIVINQGLATSRELKVGDTVTIKLRDFADLGPNGSGYAKLSGYQDVLQPVGQEEAARTQVETYEIVGIYEDSTYGTSHDQKPVYIPLSTYPESFTPTVASNDDRICSFVLDSPAHEEAFLDASRNDLAAMGYMVTLLENGYRNFQNATEGIDAASKSNELIFSVILAVCFCLACFVYFRFRRKDLAISRALGVPAGTCIASSVLPLILVGGVGIITGSALAWNYTQSNAETLLAALVEAASAEGATATLPMGTLVILIVSLIAALLVLALIFAAATVKKPVLSQLQGGGNKR